MEERRSVPRDRTYLTGRIVFNGRNSTADCVVRNLTSHGAKIALSESAAIPREFDFLIPGKREIVRAQIVWRQGSQAGLTFLR